MFKIAQLTSAGVKACSGTPVPVNSFSILVHTQRILMPSDGKHFPCIPTICFPGIYHRQLHCQLSSCLLVCHTEEILMDRRRHCLKTGHFCFSLKCLFNIMNFFTGCSTSIYWMILLATDSKAVFSIVNGYLWKGKKSILCQHSGNLQVDLEKNQRGKWPGQMGKSRSVLCGRNSKIYT